MSAIIGYARTSTIEQDAGLEAQIRDLKAVGAKKIYSEKVSSTAARDKLTAALDYIRDGDVFVVTKLDRLARSMNDLIKIVETIEAKGATLRILAMNLDTATPTGRLMLNVLGSVAQWEREMMLERQREGIAKAKAAGKYKGRAKTARKPANYIAVTTRLAAGESATKVAADLGISRSSLYRIRDDLKKRVAKRRAASALGE